MNFLAHLYLSGDSEEVAIGNFISDFVKGRDYVQYPAEIRKGILLHRKIDSFTDIHPIVRKSKSYFAPKYRKYAGVITDVLYDHYLVNDWKKYSDIEFDHYVAGVHNLLKNYAQYLPPQVGEFVPYFIRNKWLKNYGTFDGLESVFIGMSKGTSLPDESAFAMDMIHEHYKELHEQFGEFFPQLIAYVEAQLEEMVQPI
jgi:acyl carrier protein phosphodiesterase